MERATANRALVASFLCLLCGWLTAVCGGAPAVGEATQGGDAIHTRQSFDDVTVFKAGLITGSGDSAAPGGAWTGQNDPAFEIVTSPVRSAPQALKISRVDTLKRLLLLRDTPLPENRNLAVSFWCYADAHGRMGLFLYSDKKGAVPAAAGVSLMDRGRLRLYNPALPGVDKWVYTRQVAPQSTWFQCRLRFDVVQKLYWLGLVTEDGEISESEAFPFLGGAPIWTLQFLNVPPAGNHVVIDDVEVTYERRAPSTVSGRRNWAPEATLGEQRLVPTIDGDRATGIELDAGSLTVSMELATNSPVALIRIYSGRPDGSGRAGACRASGLNAAGQVPELASGEGVKVEGQAGDYAEYAFNPEVLSSLEFALAEDGKGKGVFLREIEVYSPPIPPASILNAAFAKQVYGEFRLPVYEDQEAARLHLFNVREDGKPHPVAVTLTERFSGKVTVPLKNVDLAPGENIVEFPAASLADGSYIATVEDASAEAALGPRGRLRRLLRVQHTVLAEKKAVYQMTGERLFFPDDHYLASYSKLRFEACHAEVVEAVKPVLKSADFTQLGGRIYFDGDGRLNVTFRRLNRRWMKEERNREFVATASDDSLADWTIKPLVGKSEIPPQGPPVWGPEPATALSDWRSKRVGGKPVPLRFYDPETDGKVVLNQVAFRRLTRSAPGTVMHQSDLDWSAIKPLGGSLWPVWFKAPGVGLVLMRESLLQEMPLLMGDLEDPKAANDNWAGQYLSDDGTTLMYIHANLLRRFPPFNAPWDNLAKGSRILTVYRTTDGITYERSHMALPDESDPPASQHYGAIIRRAAKGNGLRLAYLLRYKAFTQQIDTVASYSWDGVRWGCFHGEDVFAGNGPHGSWSAGHVWPGYAAVERDGKVYHVVQRVGGIYHFQSEIANSRTDETIKQVTAAWMQERYGPRHLEESPLFDLFGSWDALASHTRNTGVGVGVLVYRKEGLFCMAAGEEEGEFLTLPIVADGGLRVNAEIADAGTLALELTDADGNALPEYSGGNAVRLAAGDYMDQALSFGGLGRVPAGEFRIRARMRRAKLYTFSLGE